MMVVILVISKEDEIILKHKKFLLKIYNDKQSQINKNNNERKIESISMVLAFILLVVGTVLYNAFNCKFVFIKFDYKRILITLLLQMVLWAITFTVVKIILIKTKYKSYGYIISLSISFLNSFIFLELFEIDYSNTNTYSWITGVILALVYIVYAWYGRYTGKKEAHKFLEEKDEFEREMLELNREKGIQKEKSRIRKIKKNSRRKNRKHT